MTNYDGLKTATHARGDQHAADIIEGRYPFERALADHCATVAMLEAMALSHVRRERGEVTPAEVMLTEGA